MLEFALDLVANLAFEVPAPSQGMTPSFLPDKIQKKPPSLTLWVLFLDVSTATQRVHPIYQISVCRALEEPRQWRVQALRKLRRVLERAKRVLAEGALFQPVAGLCLGLDEPKIDTASRLAVQHCLHRRGRVRATACHDEQRRAVLACARVFGAPACSVPIDYASEQGIQPLVLPNEVCILPVPSFRALRARGGRHARLSSF
mmetsp:Transcript_43902/g.121486  ORF Transcript_43902/g.121486 Transcript_43902/m.121486 type:complete len:202 (+) Transcript_43902:328-933(+)